MTTVIKLNEITFVGRSTKGVYHKMLGNSVARCNTRSGIKLSLACSTNFERATESSFCKKCFPEGKPTSFTEIEM